MTAKKHKTSDKKVEGITSIPCCRQPINVISFGAGKQSTYMLLTALQGNYDLKPDLAIFSDTGCEPLETYRHLNWIKEYVKREYDFDIVIVQKGNLVDDIIDYVDGKKTSGNPQIPLQLKDGGIVRRHCTSDYKIAPLRKYLQGIRNGRNVRLWIGISLDEMERQKTSDVKYIEHYYPLIEKRISIDQIRKWFNDNEIAEPMKSSCTICPFHSINFWKMFAKNFPNEFEKVCVVDEKIRNYPKLKSETYLHRYRVPLREVDMTYQPSLFPELIEECYGICGL